MAASVRSVSQAFSILRLLAASSPLSLTDVARSTGLGPSSALNLLATLVAEHAVERDARTKRYRLAPGWAEIGPLHGGPAMTIAGRAAPLMERFAHVSGAAVGLWQIVSRDRMELVLHVESDAAVRLRLADAQRQPLGGGAAGRALAAAQAIDRAELARRFAGVRWQVDLGLSAYADQVGEAVGQGFAIDRGFAHRGVWTVAAALPDVGPGFCLSASVSAESTSDAGLAAMGADLAALRDSLSGS